MALSGSISSPPVTFGNYIRLDWERIATNTTNRTSTIRYRLYLVLVAGSWVDATESFSISTMDGSSDGSRGVTYRGPGGTHLIHEYTNTVTHYDGDPVTLGAMATLRSGWNQLGTVITDFGTWTLDAMSLPTAPNTKYWVGGTGTWDNTAGSKWSTSPGGAGGASVPQPNEDVVISGAGTVTLGIDTPAVRQLTVGAPINLNGKTVTCARSQFNMQNFSLGSATINAYNSISFSTQTIDLGTGTLRVTHGSTLTIDGSPYTGGFHVSPWTTTVTAGTSSIEINVNPGTGNSMDVVLGTHTYNIMKIIIGGASTGAVSAAISGSPTFRSLIIKSKNSAAHTVNFDNGALINVNKLVAVGSSSSNRLAINSDSSSVLAVDDYGSSYGQFVNMNISSNMVSYAPMYIGSNSVQTSGYGWLLQDPPKISTLVDPLTTAPGSNTNWTTTGSVASVSNGQGGGGYSIGIFSSITSTDTFDMVGDYLVFETKEMLGAQVHIQSDVGDTIPPSDYGFTLSPDKYYRATVTEDGLYQLDESIDGSSWSNLQSRSVGDVDLYRSIRIKFLCPLGAPEGAGVIGSVNMLPAVSGSGGNFLAFFGGL